MNIGASTKSFGGLTVSETAELFAKSGLNRAELCFCQSDLSGWKFNLCGRGIIPEVGRVYGAVKEFYRHGVTVCGLGLYNCLWAGGAEKAVEAVEYFAEFCDMAKESGVEMICTHTGTPGFGLYGQRQPEDLKERALELFMYALFEAFKRGIAVAVEFGAEDALCGYDGYILLKERAQRVLGTSEMLKYIGVPSGDKPGADYGEVGLFHIKDKDAGGRFYGCFGSGAGDFSEFFKNIAQYRDIPMILEFVNSSNLGRVREEFEVSASESSQELGNRE